MVQAVRVNLSQYVDLALSHARFAKEGDGAWTVEVPVLPGCVTWGATRGQAVQMARDAIEAWVLTAIRFGDDVPPIDGCSLQYGADEARHAPPLS
jgi:predicted RNase H-like HicB family nuclease